MEPPPTWIEDQERESESVRERESERTRGERERVGGGLDKDVASAWLSTVFLLFFFIRTDTIL